jgi:hypothetical protein
MDNGDSVLLARLVDLTQVPLDRLADLTSHDDLDAPAGTDQEDHSVLAESLRRIAVEARYGAEMFVGYNDYLP